MKKTAAAILMLFTFTLAAGEVTIEELLKKYNGIKTFSTEYTRFFTQNTTGKKSNDNGTIYYQAPANIKMDTYSDEKLVEQTYVDSSQTTFIYHKKKSALIKKSAGEAGEYLAFLQGTENLKKKFKIKNSTASIPKARKIGLNIKDGSVLFKLTPKKSIGNVKYIFLVALNNKIDSVVIIDQLNNINQFVFKNIKHNPKIKKGIFKPSIPKGYEISNF